jgi:hypothetical protein
MASCGRGKENIYVWERKTEGEKEINGKKDSTEGKVVLYIGRPESADILYSIVLWY